MTNEPSLAGVIPKRQGKTGNGVMKTGFVQCEALFGAVDRNLEQAGGLITGSDAELLHTWDGFISKSLIFVMR